MPSTERDKSREQPDTVPTVMFAPAIKKLEVMPTNEPSSYSIFMEQERVHPFTTEDKSIALVVPDQDEDQKVDQNFGNAGYYSGLG